MIYVIIYLLTGATVGLFTHLLGGRFRLGDFITTMLFWPILIAWGLLL